jgi:hypothetical protein
MLDTGHKARIFTNLDRCRSYNLNCINEGYVYKMAFRTHYGQCEYGVMSSGQMNALAEYQSYINEWQLQQIEDFSVCYLDNILNYLPKNNEDEEHVRKVRQ